MPMPSASNAIRPGFRHPCPAFFFASGGDRSTVSESPLGAWPGPGGERGRRIVAEGPGEGQRAAAAHRAFDAEPAAKSTNSRPARASPRKLPSVLKKRLPRKSGITSVSSRISTKLGWPPRCGWRRRRCRRSRSTGARRRRALRGTPRRLTLRHAAGAGGSGCIAGPASRSMVSVRAATAGWSASRISCSTPMSGATTSRPGCRRRAPAAGSAAAVLPSGRRRGRRPAGAAIARA